MTETTGQFRQEAAVAGADFQRGGGGFEVQRIEQRQHAVAVLRQAGEQVLAGLEAAGHAREEVLAGGAALRVDGGDASLYLGGQLQLIDFFEQRRVQFAAEAVALRQVAPVEDRVAFAAGGQQAGLGQHLQMVTHAGLADGEDLRQFQYAERVAGQRPQHVQAQRIAAGLAQGGERIAGVETDLGDAQAHKSRSLVGHFSYSKGNIKKF
ncbi:hypothetical protein SSTU70S_04029 [Stutzerimonas stutzeri]